MTTQPDRTAQDVQGMSDEEAFRRWAGDGVFMPSHPHLSGWAASTAKMAYLAALRLERARVSAICDKIETLMNDHIWNRIDESDDMRIDDVLALVEEIRK